MLAIADDDEFGQFFHSKFWPKLKFFVHDGPKNEMGAFQSLYSHVFSFKG